MRGNMILHDRITTIKQYQTALSLFLIVYLSGVVSPFFFVKDVTMFKIADNAETMDTNCLHAWVVH